MKRWVNALRLLSIISAALAESSGRISKPAFVAPSRSAFASPNLKRARQSSGSLLYKTFPQLDLETTPFAVHEPEVLPELFSLGATTVLPGPNDVTVSLLPSDKTGESYKRYPLVITPKSSDQQSLSFLSSFTKHNQDWIDDMLLRYGALLFRGFDITTAQDVEDVLLSYEEDKLSSTYRGTSPRHTQGNTEYVFSAAEVPSHFPIAQHIEMSFLPAPPKKLFFGALKAPRAIGGETALADFRKVYQALPKKLRQKLQSKKLRYTRTHKNVGERMTHDVAAMMSWSELFGTNNKTEVERLTAAENTPMRWEGRNHDIFVSEFETEAFQLHPQTDETVWFNHAQVFHWTSFPAELFAAFRRTRDLRYLTRAVLIGSLALIKYGILRQKMALHVAFGDGTPLSVWEMHQIRKAVHQNTVYNRWEQGDIVMIDNYSTSHGRQPTYDKGRNVVVAWSEALLKSDALKDSHL